MPTRAPPPPPLSYGPSLITEQQWYFTPKQLAHPPSCDRARLSAWREPIKLGEERYARALAMQRIWNLRNMMSCGTMLRPWSSRSPLVVVSTSAILMHRFYMVKSVQDFPPEDVGSAVFFLVNKVEEHPTPLRHIIGYCLAIERNVDRDHIRLDHKGRPEYDPNDELAQNISKRILYTEDAMLHALCFDLHVQSPFFAVVEALKRVYNSDLEQRDQINFVAWQILQDVLATTLVIRYRAHELAAAAILCALAQLGLPIATPKSRTKNGTRRTNENGASDDVEMVDVAPDTSKDGGEGEEGEEVEPEEDLFDVFEVTMDKMREIVKLLAETWELAQDSYVVHEGRRLRKYVYQLLDIPHDTVMDKKSLPPEIPRAEPRRKLGFSTPRHPHTSGRTPNPYQQNAGHSTPGDHAQFASNPRHDTYQTQQHTPNEPPPPMPSGQGLIPAPPPPPFPELYGLPPQQQGYNHFNQKNQHHNNQFNPNNHYNPSHQPPPPQQQQFQPPPYPMPIPQNQSQFANQAPPPFQPPPYGGQGMQPNYGSSPAGGPVGPKYTNANPTTELNYDDRRRNAGGWTTQAQNIGNAPPHPNLPFAASALPPRPQVQQYDDVPSGPSDAGSSKKESPGWT
ncbi:BQ2448_2539 [Microbotryum intermedium]|uniref:BQ2448_2539 protein n=1 Tax=Microbotryum intermedium TaxID=269621 RepID=A0A238F9U6_9BASI|nr:BQ2448_2539 [Microbotryum intermedium]